MRLVTVLYRTVFLYRFFWSGVPWKTAATAAERQHVICTVALPFFFVDRYRFSCRALPPFFSRLQQQSMRQYLS